MSRALLLGALALMAVGCSSSADPESTAGAPAPKTTEANPSPSTPPPSANLGTGQAPSDVHKNASGDHPPPGVD